MNQNKGREEKGREGKGREGKGREGKGREGKGREEKGREGKGREGKGREGKGREKVKKIKEKQENQILHDQKITSSETNTNKPFLRLLYGAIFSLPSFLLQWPQAIVYLLLELPVHTHSSH